MQIREFFNGLEGHIGCFLDRIAEDAGEAGDQRGAIAGLELVEHAAVDDARDHLADLEGLARVARHHAIELGGIAVRLARLGDVEIVRASCRERV